MQIAEKRRRDAEEKAVRRAEDTEEERKVYNYLSTQAAHLRTRTMNPQQAAAFANGALTDSMVGNSTTISGARPNYVNLSRHEQHSIGLDRSSCDSSAGHLKGDSHGSLGGGLSGPMAPNSLPHRAEHSNSLSSLGAGDSRAHDQHMAALRTTLGGVDFIDNGPLRGPARVDHGTRIQRPAQLGSGDGSAGAAALPDLLREVQQAQKRLKAQFAAQLEGYGPETSQKGPQKAAQWSVEERQAATQQLAHVEVCYPPATQLAQRYAHFDTAE